MFIHRGKFYFDLINISKDSFLLEGRDLRVNYKLIWYDVK